MHVIEYDRIGACRCTAGRGANRTQISRERSSQGASVCHKGTVSRSGSAFTNIVTNSFQCSANFHLLWLLVIAWHWTSWTCSVVILLITCLFFNIVESKWNGLFFFLLQRVCDISFFFFWVGGSCFIANLILCSRTGSMTTQDNFFFPNLYLFVKIVWQIRKLLK